MTTNHDPFKNEIAKIVFNQLNNMSIELGIEFQLKTHDIYNLLFI